jgi:hypothetical protein
MSDFLQLLDDVFEKSETSKPIVHPAMDMETKVCKHEFGGIEHGRVCCISCGVQQVARDAVHSVGPFPDQDNMQVRRSDDRTIIGDLLKMNLSYEVCQYANKKFVSVTRGKTFRCKSRRALMCCSVFLAQKELHGMADHQALQELFDVDSRKIMQAMKVLCFTSKESSRGTSDNVFAVSTEEITRRTMELFGASNSHVNEAINILADVKDKSILLSRSRPQSMAASVVFFWIVVNRQPINMERFKRYTNISPTTMARYCTEISIVTRIGLGIRWGSLHRQNLSIPLKSPAKRP